MISDQWHRRDNTINNIECRARIRIRYNKEALAVILTNDSRSTTSDVYVILYNYNPDYIIAFRQGDFILNRSKEPYMIIFEDTSLTSIALELHQYDEYYDFMLSFEYVMSCDTPEYLSDEELFHQLDQEDDDKSQMDADDKPEKATDEWFSILHEIITGTPHPRRHGIIVFDFELKKDEFIADIYISSSEAHDYGDLYADGNHLMSSPKWQSDLYVGYTYPKAKQMMYDTMTGRDSTNLCSKCQEPLTADQAPRKLYLPFSTDPYIHKTYDLMSSKWKNFKVEINFLGSVPPNTTLVLRKIIKHTNEAK